MPVSVTKVSGGGWGDNVPITVPSEVKVEFYWQLMPGEEEAQVEGEFVSWLDKMVADKPNDFTSRPAFVFPIRFMPTGETPAESPIVQALSPRPPAR